jgi:hypothetical protein
MALLRFRFATTTVTRGFTTRWHGLKMSRLVPKPPPWSFTLVLLVTQHDLLRGKQSRLFLFAAVAIGFGGADAPAPQQIASASLGRGSAPYRGGWDWHCIDRIGPCSYYWRSHICRIAPSFNGRTAASGAAYRGSNPWGATTSAP